MEKNICVRKVQSSTKTTDMHSAEFILENKEGTYWEPCASSLILDLGEITKFNRVTIYEHADADVIDTIHILGYTLDVSNDGINYEMIDSYEVKNPETKSGAITLSGVHNYYRVDCKQQQARYIRFTVTKTKPGTLPQISKIEVSQREITQLDREWSQFTNDKSWQNEIDVSAIGKGSMIADCFGGTLQLMVTDRPFVNDVTEDVEFSVDCPEIASVSATGLVTAKKPGLVQVKAVSKTTGLSGSLKIEILDPGATYKNSWDDLIETYQVPDWYRNSKFGLYFHWGAYAVIAHGNEWFISRMHKKEEDDERFFLDKFGKYDSLGNRIGYKDCYKYFMGDKFHADEWADLAIKAGARFLVPVSEHHDGFTLYDSSYTRWKAPSVSLKRDVIRELKEAALKKGLKFGFSNHYKEKHVFFDPVDDTEFEDTFEPNNFDFYANPSSQWNKEKQNTLDQQWYNRTTELVDKYDPDFMLFDWHVVGDDYTKDFLTHYYNHAEKTNPDGVIMTIKLKALDGGYVRGVERGRAAEIRDLPWEGNTSISRKSWGYIEDEEYKSSLELVNSLADIVSKNGVFLLNVGPDRHGCIPKEAQDILCEIGDWLKNNGEAIYNTRPWSVYGEGPTTVPDGYLDEITPDFTSEDFRFTQSIDQSRMYIIGMKYPEKSRKIVIKTLNKEFLQEQLKKVILLNGEKELDFSVTETGLEINLLDTNPDKKVDAYALRLEFKTSVPQLEVVKYKITVIDGTSNYFSAKKGTSVVINALEEKDGAKFKYWKFLGNSPVINNVNIPHAHILVQDEDIVVQAIYGD